MRLCGQNIKGLGMNLTDREIQIMEAISSIGKGNLSMKELADKLCISYDYLLHKKCEMVQKNGYLTFTGFLCDYVREKAMEDK